jgi:peroxiredoxin
MLAAGNRAPEIRAAGLDGRQVAVSDLLAEGPVLAVFFKVSCPTCQYTLPFLQRMADQGGLTIVGISQDETGPTHAFCKTYGVRFPVLLDTAKEKYPLSNVYKLRSVPSCFLIETDGRISAAVQGFSRDDLDAIGRRFHTPPFHADEDIPAFRPG